MESDLTIILVLHHCFVSSFLFWLLELLIVLLVATVDVLDLKFAKCVIDLFLFIVCFSITY